jgi:hypothetical protein
MPKRFDILLFDALRRVVFQFTRPGAADNPHFPAPLTFKGYLSSVMSCHL